MKVKVETLRMGDILLAHNSKRKHTAIYYMDGKVIHASIGEKGTKGNRPGDQTGREICVAGLSGEWDYVLRCPDEAKARQATMRALAIAQDDSHGYDQVNRTGDPDYDCSSLVFAVYAAFGYAVRKYGSWTGDLYSAFTRCGFTEVKQVVFCNVELIEVYPGDKGQVVKTMQALLKLRGYDPGEIDGSNGPKTQAALDKFQRAYKLTPYDKVCGRGTWKALII